MFNFTYPITRPLPYSWFKWAVLFGGIVLTILLSLLNLASNGYDLIVQHSTDPNGTVSDYSWTNKLPVSIDGKTSASCEPQNLQATTQYFTNKFGLTYTLAGVWQVDGSGKKTTLPSLQYLNNPLEDCNVTLIILDFDQWDDRSASEIGWIPWGMKATGYTTCAVDNDGRTKLNLTTEYTFVVPTIETGVPFQFIRAPEEQSDTTLYWGQSLMSWYWLDAVHAMDNQSTPVDMPYQVTKGSVGAYQVSFDITSTLMSKALQPSKNVSDITSLEYFAPPTYHFVTQNFDPELGLSEPPSCCINNNYLLDASIGLLHAYSLQQMLSDEITYNRIPDIWIPVDSFAKVFMSTILADLGQNSSQTALNNAATLQYFSKNITMMGQGSGYNVFWTNNTAPLNGSVENWLKAGPARMPYNKADGGNFTIDPSMLYNQYTCQVPKLKSAGSLIFAILVADLVFLRLAWAILNWGTVYVMQRRVSTSNHCTGCMNDAMGNVTLVSVPAAKMRRSYEPVPDVY